jgi:hypothetical protein
VVALGWQVEDPNAHELELVVAGAWQRLDFLG